jgi:hypothetical protein
VKFLILEFRANQNQEWAVRAGDDERKTATEMNKISKM